MIPPQLLKPSHFNTAKLPFLKESDGDQHRWSRIQVRRDATFWLKHYCSVSNMDSSMWLTVRGGVSPSPITPSSYFEPRWRFYVCACVEKAARRAVCQLSAHVVNIRNQTGANRMQVRLGIAFICTNNPQWCLIISHCYISKQLALILGEGGAFNISINRRGVRLNSFDHLVWTRRQMPCLQVFAPSVSCPLVCGSSLDCVCSQPAMSHGALSCRQEESADEAVFVTPPSCYSHSAFVRRYPHL